MVLNLASYGTMIGESVHSGHFMMSSLTDESSDTDSGCRSTRRVGRMQTTNRPALSFAKDVVRNTAKQLSNNDHMQILDSSVADVIDGSLITLLQCMTLDYRWLSANAIIIGLLLPLHVVLMVRGVMHFGSKSCVDDRMGVAKGQIP